MRLKGTRGKIKIFLLCLGVIGASIFFTLPQGKFILTQVQKASDLALQKADWTLKEVQVVGLKRTTNAEWEKAVNAPLGTPMNAIDLNQVRENLLKLPWVQWCVVKRSLPNKLKIDILEKTPIALWQNKGVYHPLDEFGHPIQDTKFSSEDLILVVGQDAPENTIRLLNALDKVPDISKQIRSATRVEGRRWNLYTTENIKILLPQDKMELALKRLQKKEVSDGLLKKEVASIDMRLDDRITLHPKKMTVQKKGKK